jgi:ABC-type uncharacterized transport system involved in gliding motility auxiliary subunit
LPSGLRGFDDGAGPVKRYLAMPGALLLIAAFVRAAAAVHWDGVSIGLAIAGAVIVAAAAAWNRREVVEWIRDPRGVFAVTTGISVAVFIAALVMLNIAVWYHPWSVDLTRSGRNQVSGGTKQMLARLQQPVALRQFGRASDPRVDQLLHGFERESPRVRVEFADVDRERDLATRYGIIKLGTVIVVSGDKFRKVEDANEQALVTAILQVTANDERIVCFVTGHGERGLDDQGPTGLAALKAILQASNYTTEAISLLEGDVPSHCNAVVIAGAQQEFLPQELDRVSSMKPVLRLAWLLEPDPAPSFAEWLRPRGIEPLPGGIVDTSGAGQSVGGSPRTPLAVRYLDHPITRGFDIATMYDGARPLRIVPQPDFGGKPTALAQTSPRSFATRATDAVPAFDGGRDTPGPLALAAATSLGSSARPEQQARLVVVGDPDFISNAFLRRQGNRDFFLRSLAWLLGEQESTVVAVEPRENRRVELTQQMRAWMYIVNLGLLPLLPLVAGIVVFIRSRR